MLFLRLRYIHPYKSGCLSHRLNLIFSSQTADATIARDDLMNLFFPSCQKSRIADNAPLFVLLLKKV